MSKKVKIDKEYDFICVGGGIMSATLSLMLKLLDPNLKIIIFERLDEVAQESSAAPNNAGTGHSAFCELNYTPEKEDGSIDISKAKRIFEEFEISKQFWSYLVKNGMIKDPQSFIHTNPHHAWVPGERNSIFLKKRYEAMTSHFMFENMEFSEDHEILKKWFPLIMENRDGGERMAATRMELGTSVNFGSLTKQYLEILKNEFDVPVLTQHEVLDVDPGRQAEWLMEVRDRNTGDKKYYDAEHVFIGAGGGALPLLQKVEINEKDGYGGFPISGQWLFCKNEEIIKQHDGKVYSKAGVGTPPMSVPHLDTRYINGKKELMFGPFAGFSTKFLKEGSRTDLPKSINLKNIPSMWGVFWHNLDLTKYLIEQVSMSHSDRVEELRAFIKDAKPEDWELQVAGQRVQIIKRDKEQGGVLEFGTDVIHNKDGSITALLGASPGASVAVKIMLDVLEIVFPEKLKSKDWEEKLSDMIPFWNKDVENHKEEFLAVQKDTSQILQLEAVH
ncbi:malate dehydrogenase (quinone) [Salinimicrobium sp. GXAS 041]|uniref:malate dehydrogenase (quinone) n=1 Tax=Salinimicrobium sp. GXAS 041 TaxID=3400806 RepID=UPI003C74E2A5